MKCGRCFSKMLIKVRFLKGETPHGKTYTYDSGDFDVAVGDKVNLPNGKGIVVEIDVPEEEVAAFKDKIKTIESKFIEESEDK